MKHIRGVRGLPYMTSARFSNFFTPSPLVTVTNKLILFLSSAFWGPPPPTDCRRHIWKTPKKFLLIPSRITLRLLSVPAVFRLIAQHPRECSSNLTCRVIS